MFGHAKGAYTGAHCDRQGRFEAAHQGVFFFDEIGELSTCQTRLSFCASWKKGWWSAWAITARQSMALIGHHRTCLLT
ncbi:MAG: sigma 54-interacting transcriptional regulator [Desulfobacterales bacterium]|nr:sigma 54-interacting transcriptional regulator [Desulfobacterales bacterium]